MCMPTVRKGLDGNQEFLTASYVLGASLSVSVQKIIKILQT